jgi:diacylglycerol kinase
MESLGVIISAAGFALVIVSSVGGLVWRVARGEMALRAEFNEEITELKAKVYEVEIWARDEFVRKGSFETVVTRLEKTMELMGTKIETAVDKMGTKIENLSHREHDRPVRQTSV